MFKSCRDFVFLSLQPGYLTAYSHFTPQTVLWPRAGLGPQLAFKMWAEVKTAHFCCSTVFSPFLNISSFLIGTAVGYRDDNKPATKKNARRRKQKKADYPIFRNWNLQDHLQKRVNSFNPTLICILSVFPLSEHIKRCQGLSHSKAGFYLKKTF